jgi:hypothetical protein
VPPPAPCAAAARRCAAERAAAAAGLLPAPLLPLRAAAVTSQLRDAQRYACCRDALFFAFISADIFFDFRRLPPLRFSAYWLFRLPISRLRMNIDYRRRCQQTRHTRSAVLPK